MLLLRFGRRLLEVLSGKLSRHQAPSNCMLYNAQTAQRKHEFCIVRHFKHHGAMVHAMDYTKLVADHMHRPF